MTTAPSDLLALRVAARAAAGLGAVEVGIVGDGAHQRTGGFHEGVDVLKAIGRYHGPASANVGSSGEDYSARQARDRNGLSLSSSAVDIGSAWRNGGRPAWLRFNNLLHREMVDHPQNLPALRAINVSLDGRTKRRFDQNSRSAGLISSNDTVDTHTHLEFWRDTEGRRQATLDRVVALMRAAVANTTPAATTAHQEALTMLSDEQWYDIWLGSRLASGMDAGVGRTDDRWKTGNRMVAAIQSLQATAAQSAQREQDMLTALKALATGGAGVDTGVVLARIEARTADVTGLLQQQATRISELEAELEQFRHAQHAAAQAEADATADRP